MKITVRGASACKDRSSHFCAKRLPVNPPREFAVHVCVTTAGLDELTRRQQKDGRAVLRVLSQTRRFSVFEATANQTIAKTIDHLFAAKQVEVDPDGYNGFPWTAVRLTAAGAALLKEAP